MIFFFLMAHFFMKTKEKIHFMKKHIASPPIILVNMVSIFLSLIISKPFLSVYWSCCLRHFFCELLLSFAPFLLIYYYLSDSLAKSTFHNRHIDLGGRSSVLLLANVFPNLFFAFLIVVIMFLLYVRFQFFTVSQIFLFLCDFFHCVYI